MCASWIWFSIPIECITVWMKLSWVAWSSKQTLVLFFNPLKIKEKCIKIVWPEEIRVNPTHQYANASEPNRALGNTIGRSFFICFFFHLYFLISINDCAGDGDGIIGWKLLYSSMWCPLRWFWGRCTNINKTPIRYSFQLPIAETFCQLGFYFFRSRSSPMTRNMYINIWIMSS